MDIAEYTNKASNFRFPGKITVYRYFSVDIANKL